MYIKHHVPAIVIPIMSTAHEASYHPWQIVTRFPSTRDEWQKVREALLWDTYQDPETRESKRGRDVRRIGGSGLATLYGQGHMTLGVLCQSLRGSDSSERKSDSIMLGHGVKYEAYARVMYRHMFMDYLEYLVEEPTRRYREHYVTSPDNIVISTRRSPPTVDRVVEYKCPYRQTLESFLHHAGASPCGIPERYLAQLELYCRALDTETADLCILFGRTPGADRYLEMPLDELDSRFDELYEADQTTFDNMCICLQYRRNDAFWQLLQEKTELVYDHARRDCIPRFGSNFWPSRAGALAEVRACFSIDALAVEQDEWPDMHTE